MTINEAAESLGLAPSTLRRQITNGNLAAAKHGRDWWVDPAEVERYRADHLGRFGPRGPRPTVARSAMVDALTQARAMLALYPGSEARALVARIDELVPA